MWLLLKEGRADDAWNELVAAQGSLAFAVKAHEGFAHVDGNIRRLDAIERLVFPPQVFLSSGLIVRSQICSICEKEYEDCDHVKGRPYMGEICTITLVPSAVDHVSIVDNPADKRCRILQFDVDGGRRNRMTWAVEPNANAEPSASEDMGPRESLTATGIVGVVAPSRGNTEKDIRQ